MNHGNHIFKHREKPFNMKVKLLSYFKVQILSVEKNHILSEKILQVTRTFTLSLFNKPRLNLLNHKHYFKQIKT